MQDTLLPLAIAGAWLVRPGPEHLAAGLAALDAGWSADTQRGADAAREEAEALRRDPEAWIAGSDDPVGVGTVTLPDGSRAQRLPWMRRWIWDGDFCGSITLRWQPGTPELPPHVLGHIGYAVVPGKRGRGLARAALAAMLAPARARSALGRADHRRGQPRLAARDRPQRWRAGRAFQQARGPRGKPRPALAHHPLSPCCTSAPSAPKTRTT